MSAELMPGNRAASGANPGRGRPAVFAKFSGPEILGEQGRLLFSLLNAFASSGHPVLLFDDLPADRLGKYGTWARSLPNVTLAHAIPGGTEGMYYLFDREERSIGRLGWRKRIRVRFDVFAPYRSGRPVFMPYPVHPVHASADLRERLAELRSNRRRMRVFFSGETAGYDRVRVHYPTAKLPRLKVIDTVRERMGESVLIVDSDAALAQLRDGDYVRKCVLIDTRKLRIADRDWLRVLSGADFFLAPPGIVMPMCHNSVEALAVGAVPVTNYPEWFQPALEHGRNCLVFGDERDLVAKLELALAMDEATIAAMREAAVGYFDAHLGNESFMGAIEADEKECIDVLVITEGYVGRNAHRLNERSALVGGDVAPGRLAWLRRLVQH